MKFILHLCVDAVLTKWEAFRIPDCNIEVSWKLNKLRCTMYILSRFIVIVASVISYAQDWKEVSYCFGAAK